MEIADMYSDDASPRARARLCHQVDHGTVSGDEASHQEGHVSSHLHVPERPGPCARCVHVLTRATRVENWTGVPCVCLCAGGRGAEPQILEQRVDLVLFLR